MSIKQDTENHVLYIRKLREQGGKAYSEKIKLSNDDKEPSEVAGLFTYDQWVPDKDYTKNELFMYDGIVGFARNNFTSSDVYKPFTVGTESLYGVRPRQNPDGTYPYVRNMLIIPDMLIRSEKDGKLYKCILSDEYTLLYDPADAVGVCVLVE